MRYGQIHLLYNLYAASLVKHVLNHCSSSDPMRKAHTRPFLTTSSPPPSTQSRRAQHSLRSSKRSPILEAARDPTGCQNLAVHTDIHIAGKEPQCQKRIVPSVNSTSATPATASYHTSSPKAAISDPQPSDSGQWDNKPERPRPFSGTNPRYPASRARDALPTVRR